MRNTMGDVVSYSSADHGRMLPLRRPMHIVKCCKTCTTSVRLRRTAAARSSHKTLQAVCQWTCCLMYNG